LVSATLVLIVVSFASFAAAQDAGQSGVRITFLPPPMEGTLSLGIFDKKGKLVRVLAREATEKDFTIGLNGFITHWDGKDDAGRVMPADDYLARGYSVGVVEVEGVALHGNDWITDDDSPRYAHVTDIRTKGPDEIEVALEKVDGTAGTIPVRFETEPAAVSAASVKVADGKVLLSKDGDPRDFALGDGETAIDAALGVRDRLWIIVRTPDGVEVRAYTLEGEFLRRLSYAPGGPLPWRILAARGTFSARWSEQILLLEQNERIQRVRSLALPEKPAAGDAPLWSTVLEKTIWRGATFDAVKDLLPLPGAKPFAAEKEFVVKLINNPLLKDEPASAHVAVGFNEHGSFLQTTDGLPLRRITETPQLKWVVIGREGSGKQLTIFQSDGAVVEEFKAHKLANMMAFDAGDYEWTGK
jgi:hypothetical protein